MTVRTVHVGGLELTVQLGGSGEPILFVHGLGGSGRSWAPAARRLTER